MATWRFLFLSPFPPHQGGVAGFTRDMVHAISASARSGGEDVARADVAGLEQDGVTYRDEDRVVFTANPRRPGDLARLAAQVNKSSYDAVCVQYEPSLYPGAAADELLEFHTACRKPIVTTLHELPQSATPESRRLLGGIADRSEHMVVMAARAADILRRDYGVPSGRIQLIPHGTPEIAFGHRPTLKHELGLGGRRVITTFCLLSRRKGIEYMIDAMEMVSKQHPEALYLILGRTSPEEAGTEGEAYREMLEARAARLRRSDSVRFINRFLPTAGAVAYLQAGDIYVTPYLDPNQTTSGTLAYALAAGKAIVSTPYLHAEEVLSDSRGILVPFRDSCSLAGAVMGLLGNPSMTEQLERRAYDYARRTHWSVVGRHYLELLAEAGLKTRLLPHAAGRAATVGSRP